MYCIMQRNADPQRDAGRQRCTRKASLYCGEQLLATADRALGHAFVSDGTAGVRTQSFRMGAAVRPNAELAEFSDASVLVRRGRT